MRIDRVVCTGGIAEKNPLLMQIYADVTGRAMQVAGSSQTCALGSAIAAAVLAGEHPDFETAQAAMTTIRPEQYEPSPKTGQSMIGSTRSIASCTTVSAASPSRPICRAS